MYLLSTLPQLRSPRRIGDGRNNRITKIGAAMIERRSRSVRADRFVGSRRHVKAAQRPHDEYYERRERHRGYVEKSDLLGEPPSTRLRRRELMAIATVQSSVRKMKDPTLHCGFFARDLDGPRHQTHRRSPNRNRGRVMKEESEGHSQTPQADDQTPNVTDRQFMNHTTAPRLTLTTWVTGCGF